MSAEDVARLAKLDQCEATIRDGISVLDSEGARALTHRIKANLVLAYVGLLEAEAREAWSALGYSSMAAYVTVEFEVSQSRAYQILDHARVLRALESAGLDSTIVESTNEAQAREVAAIIKADGPERAAEILTEVAEDGPVTAKAIREAARPTREVTTSETVTVDAETGEIVPPAPSRPHRRPLPDAMRDASHELLKSAQRLERLTSDDRWPRNAKQATAMTRGDLLQAIEALTTVLDRLDQSASAA